jgi:hypothetical protein
MRTEYIFSRINNASPDTTRDLLCVFGKGKAQMQVASLSWLQNRPSFFLRTCSSTEFYIIQWHALSTRFFIAESDLDSYLTLIKLQTNTSFMDEHMARESCRAKG